MRWNQKPLSRKTLAALTVLILAAFFLQRAFHNLSHVDFRNSNFVFFWLAGRMLLSGQNPYNPAAWIANHDSFGITWRPNEIFPYPLPLALFVAPLGLLTLRQAYLAWQIVSQVILAIVAWSLLNKQPAAEYRRLFLPLVVFLMYFGPAYLTLQIGAMGAFTMIAILGAIVSWEKGHAFAAGVLLSLTLLKPPQGVPILLLATVWLIARRDWRAIGGLAAGALVLLLSGMLIDPSWIIKSAGAGKAIMERTLGLQSNAFGFAYLACRQDQTCMWILGGAASMLILGAGGAWLWRNHNILGPWEALNLILPLGFVSTIYLWSYDQVLFTIPIIWLAMRLVKSTKSYVLAFVFLIVLSVGSLVALLVQANTHRDLLSILTTLLVLIAYWRFGFGAGERVLPLT